MTDARYDPGMGFGQIWGVLYLRWRIIAASMAVTIALSFIFSADRNEPVVRVPVTSPVTYHATAQYAVSVATRSDAPADESVRAAHELERSYSFAMTTDAVIERLAANLELDGDARSIRESISVGVTDRTSFITVTAHTGDSSRSLALANGLADAIADTPIYANLVLGGVAARLDRVEPAVVASPSVVQQVSPAGPVSRILTFTLVGIFAGVLVAFAVEWIDGRANWPGQVARGTGLNVVGFLDGRRRKEQTDGLFDGSDQRGMESFRSAKARLRALLATGTNPRSVLITSPGANEGKTTITSNLGEALAEDGSSVIIVSADMRSADSNETRYGDWGDRPGLSDYLLDPSLTPDNIRWDSGRPGIQFVGRGSSPDAAVPLLDSVRMKELVDTLSTQADWVLLDGPGILQSSDASRLAPHVDGTLLVVDGAITSLQSIRLAVDSLETAGARMLGFFHNRVRSNPIARMLHQDPA